LRVAGQVLAVLVFVVILIWDNLTYNLRQLGIRLGFDFLKSQASFDIGESSQPTIQPTALLEPCSWAVNSLASDSFGPDPDNDSRRDSGDCPSL